MPDVIAQAVARLGYEVDTSGLRKFEAGTSQATSSIGSLTKSLTAGIAKLGAFAAASATAAAVGLFKLVDASTQAADEVAKGARNAGFSAREYQRMQHAAGLAGVEMGVLSKSTQNLNRDIARGATAPKEFRDALADVGLTMADLSGSAEENLGTILDALRDVEDDGRRSGLSLLLLGRAGRQMGTLIEGGSEGLKAAGDEAERLGLVLDEKALTASEEFQDAMTRMQSTAAALGRDIGTALAPEVQGLVDDLRDWILANGDLLRQDIGELGHSLAGGIRAALPVLQDAIGFVTTLSQTTEGFFLLIQDAQDFITGEDTNRKRRIKEKAGERFRNKLAFISGADLQANIDQQEDPFFANIARQELERRKRISEEASTKIAEAAQRSVRGGGGGRRGGRGGGGRRSGGGGGTVDIGESSFEAFDLFGEDLSRLGQTIGASEQQIEAALQAAAQSLSGHASPDVARKAAVRQLESLTGKSLSTSGSIDDAISNALLGGGAGGGESPTAGARFVRIDASFNAPTEVEITVEAGEIEGLSADEVAQAVEARLAEVLEERNRRAFDHFQTAVRF